MNKTATNSNKIPKKPLTIQWTGVKILNKVKKYTMEDGNKQRVQADVAEEEMKRYCLENNPDRIIRETFETNDGEWNDNEQREKKGSSQNDDKNPSLWRGGGPADQGW